MSNKNKVQEKIELAGPSKELDGLEALQKGDKSLLEQQAREIAALKSKVENLESVASEDLRGFERKVKTLENAQNTLAMEMYDYPEKYVEVTRDHKSKDNGRLSKMVFDYTCWDDQQVETRKKYDENKQELTKMYQQLIAVTLIDDPEVVSNHLNCGVNGKMISIYYSGDNLLDNPNGGDSEKRVQLISYTHYVALMCQSYKVKFKEEVKDGIITQSARRVPPVIEAFLPDDELVKKHKELLRKQKR